MEITANALQTVLPNSNVLFSETPVGGSCSIIHREGSGLVTLRGVAATQPRARFRASFGANVALPAGTTVIPIRLALAVNGQPVATTTMRLTPTATQQFTNVFTSIFLDVPSCCCYQLSVENTSTGAIEVQNANLIVERVA